MNTPFNTRILVVDDEEAVRNSFREILVPTRRDFSALEAASSSLFGTGSRPTPSSELFQFHLDEADTGARGVELVSAAEAEGRPYAVIFVDMRMPGWDGLDTVRHIRKYDKRAEIIFITAYSDYSIEEVVAKAGANVGYHTKPFSPEEIRQLATKSVYEWNKTRGLENLIHVISDLRTTEAELDLLLNNILHQVADLVGSRSALLAVRDGERYSKIIGIGALADDGHALKHLESLPTVQGDSIYQSEEFIYFPMDRYGVFALFEGDAAPLRNDRIYMVQLFLEQATQAIHNAELHEELIRSEKLSAMGKGVSVVAHDLRNPLGNILSLVSLIEAEDGGSKEQVQEYLSLIRRSAENATAIVNDILDFTRDTKVEGTPVPVGRILERVDHDVRQAAEDRGVRLRISYPDAGFDVLADASKMERVLLNLSRNAVEAVVKSEGADPPEVVVSARTDGADAIFHVHDNGPGIPQDVQDHLFVPFSTVGKRGGTGLGLPIVKQFVQAHNGTINMSTSEEGTRFTIRLPNRVRPRATAETAG
ncbi:MAG: response regulator [Spirochaetes bacterium]|jgi:signal transduction histidine kinase|nr:response regulator [Spirochaetota bacterium]